MSGVLTLPFQESKMKTAQLFLAALMLSGFSHAHETPDPVADPLPLIVNLALTAPKRSIAKGVLARGVNAIAEVNLFRRKRGLP